MNKIYLIILSVFTISSESNICSCPPLPNWKKATSIEYEYSQDVLIADIQIGKNQTDYKIEVCEVFKGDLKPGQILNGKNIGTCGPYIDKDGKWILFGELSRYFRVNDCGLSSNVSEPYGIIRRPAPPMSNTAEDQEQLIAEWKMESKRVIKQQIKMLKKISESE